MSDAGPCQVHLIHEDKTRSRCILGADHQLGDSDHVDEHGHHAPVLVRQSTIREAAALAEYDRQRESELAQAQAVQDAIAAWEQAAQAAYDGEVRGKPLPTSARLIMAGDKLAALLRGREAGEEKT